MTDSLQLIDLALEAGNMSEAAALAVRALAAGSTDPLVANLVAWQHEEAGRFVEAAAVLDTALARWPRETGLLVALGSLRRREGQLKAAVEAFEAAIAIDPAYATAWFERGVTFEAGGAIGDAAEDYRQVVRLEPGNADAHAALAVVSARRGDRAEAEEHARTALRHAPGNLAARRALALVAIEDQRFVEAVELLRDVEDSPLDASHTIARLTLLGDAYDGLDRADEAYAAYSRAQDLFRQTHEARLGEDHRDAFKFLDVVLDNVATAPAISPPVSDESDAARPAIHVFLTGYPRSGTTLAENIIASLPGAIAIEERPTLEAADRDYLSLPGGLAILFTGPEASRNAMRADYWSRAERAAQQPLGDSLFVDMDPFKGPRLPVIAQLFPAAKIVLMQRDPRDVVWSCFHTNFAFNAATLSFTSLERTAQHYDRTWRIITAALERLPIDAHVLRYEDLVSDFDRTTQALCGFIGAEWSESLRSFDKTAKTRGVSTASIGQVRRGLYDGSGGWRRYERQLAAVDSLLRPWIESFGYT